LRPEPQPDQQRHHPQMQAQDDDYDQEDVAADYGAEE
jgi:hypothetical protein